MDNIKEHNDSIDPMLTMRDLDRILRRSPRTIRAWRAEGFLPKADLCHGKTVLWRRATIANWLERQASQAA